MTDFANASFSVFEVDIAGFAGCTHSMRTTLPFSGSQFPLKGIVCSFATLKIVLGAEWSSAEEVAVAEKSDGFSSWVRRIHPRDKPEICTCTHVPSTPRIGNSS